MANYDLFYVWSGSRGGAVNGKIRSSKGSCFLFRPGDYHERDA